MTDYLSLTKIIKDGVALYKRHCLYITILISAVLIPYYLITQMEEIPSFVIYIIPLFFVAIFMMEIIATNLASTGYEEREVILVDQLWFSLKKVVPYIFLTTISTVVAIFGYSLLFLPGIITTLFFNVVKVDYVVGGRSFKDSILHSYKMFSGKILYKVIKIYLIPTLLQLLLSYILTPYLNLEMLEEQILQIYPYLVLAVILLFPLTVVFKTAIYYNIIKEGYKDLQPTNELV